MKSKLFIVFLFLFSYQFTYSQSNEGTDFWLGFMEHRDVGVNTMVVMITSKVTTSGVVSIPNRNWSQSYTVAANNVTIISLPTFAEVVGSESIGNVGISITSQDPVSVYMHQYNGFRSEATVVLPIPSIGKEYFTISYSGINDNKVYPSEFLVVATEDETTVSITPKSTTANGKSGGTSFDVVLDEGETYQVQSGSTADMTGSFVQADKKIAVFSGNSWTEVPVNCGARDNLLEQMYSVETWGKEFVSVPSAKVNGDVFRVLASEDNTSISITGASPQNFTLNRGQFREYESSGANSIVADKPIIVAQYLKGAFCNGHSLGDPSMVLLNGVAQTRDTVTLYNSSLQDISENFINVIMPTADTNTVRFDGNPISSLAPLSTVGNGTYSYTTVPVQAGPHTITSAGCGVIATAYGYGNLESYAYSGGANFSSINGDPIVDGSCLNDTITFDADLPIDRFDFSWDISDGVTSNQKSFQHIYTSLGTYPVELIITDKCTGRSDTLNKDILISLRQAVDAFQDTIICEGGTAFLGATDLGGATYEWIGPDGYFSEEQFPDITNITTAQSGDYSVIGIISGCATFPQIMNIRVVPTPEPNLGPDRIYCTIDSIMILDPGNYASYVWQDGSRFYNYDVTGEGTYTVEVEDGFGCVGSDTVVLQQICPTNIFVPNAFTPNFDGENDEFKVFGSDIITMRLDVFDRWGSRIFSSTNQSEAWDGTFRGKPAQMGVYTWQLSVEGYLVDGTVYNEVLAGTVMLIR